MVVAPNILRIIKTSKGDATYSVYDLLDEIKSRPSIWQVGGVHHMNRSEYHNSWQSISQTLITQYCDLDEEEQTKITQNLRKVYGKLKNDLSVFLKYKKTGDKRYRLFNYGCKMAYVLQDRGLKLEDVFSQDEINEMEMFEKRFKECYITKSENKSDSPKENDQGNLNENAEIGESETFSNNYECGVNSNPNSAIAYERQLCKSKDPDQAFFDSLKPWLRKMNGEEKLDFKIQFLQALKKYQN